MLINENLSMRFEDMLGATELDELDDRQIFSDHVELSERLRRSLYYGRLPLTNDRPSLALTELAVQWIQQASTAPQGLRLLDVHYAAGVCRKASATPCSVMLAMLYIDWLRRDHAPFLASHPPCDVFLVSVLVASKFLYDDGEIDQAYNCDWAKATQMEIKDLNKLEREFLDAMNWNLNIKPPQFSKFMVKVEQSIARNAVSQRGGWSTYSDVVALLEAMDPEENVRWLWNIVYDSFLKVFVVSSMAYVMGMLTVIGATTLGSRLVPHLSRLSVPHTSSSALNNRLFPTGVNQSGDALVSRVTVAGHDVTVGPSAADERVLAHILNCDVDNTDVDVGDDTLCADGTCQQQQQRISWCRWKARKDHDIKNYFPFLLDRNNNVQTSDSDDR